MECVLPHIQPVFVELLIAVLKGEGCFAIEDPVVEKAGDSEVELFGLLRLPDHFAVAVLVALVVLRAYRVVDKEFPVPVR